METLTKIGASGANIALLEVTATPPTELLHAILQLCTTAATVWYLIKKPKRRKDVDVQP